ncbi:hypothetical protein JMJ77_0000097 [Colletotrichum scovillei]|uniref:Uncharacterized protein n=1 Tax=Colletotrichum scovillei TaxID=1209932 RepID=A0A9P7UDT9_9PEZI|nr:hypothetical protein JMJ77_0000097 [Colletotrichum scovillei]KAG7071298.1 hypothetical protein JMJ76_0004171 [Colletotrichum scovillei]KAG7079586.1 hypothetical protein JMJ78_0006692 [Colletotrichum scovillei]
MSKVILAPCFVFHLPGSKQQCYTLCDSAAEGKKLTWLRKICDSQPSQLHCSEVCCKMKPMPCTSSSSEELRVCGDRPGTEPHSRAEGSKPRVEI